MLTTVLLSMMMMASTDQTIPVSKGAKLEVNNFAGDVNVKVWDKDAVRIEVNHSDRETVDIRQDEGTVHVRGRSTRGGPPRSLDYTISVPSWMAISISGTYADVTLEGVGGDVSVDTTRGDIKVRGGSGFISLKSVQGEISLEKAKGRIDVRAVNEGMHLSDISGDLSAETTNGSIILDRIDSANVDLYTVNGSISYDGAVHDKGIYRLTTHNGLVAMAIPEKVNATLMVRTYNGGFRSTFPLKLADDQNPRKRFTVTLGSGSAHIELESFGGSIALRRPGEARPEVERERKHRERGDRGPELADLAGTVEEVRAEAQAAIAETAPEIEAEVQAAMADIGPEIDAALAEAAAEAGAAVPAPRIRINPAPVVVPRSRRR